MSQGQEVGGIEKHGAQQLTVTKTSGAGTRHIYTHKAPVKFWYMRFIKKNVDTLRIIYGMCRYGPIRCISSPKVGREHVIL